MYKVTVRITIISIIGYSTSYTSSVFIKVKGCSLLKSRTPPTLQGILELVRQLLTYKGMCISLECKKMPHSILEYAYFVEPANPIIESKVYTIPYLYPLNLQKAFQEGTCLFICHVVDRFSKDVQSYAL